MRLRLRRQRQLHDRLRARDRRVNRIGSRISSGSLCRTVPMALRTSSAASIMFLSKSKMTTICAWPSEAVERTRSTCPASLCSGFSMRLIDLALDRLGRRARIGTTTTSTGCSTSGSG
jgi:hypothetical protein